MAATRRPRVVTGPLEKPRDPGRLSDLARMPILGLTLALPAFLYAGLQSKLHEYRREVVVLEARIAELDAVRRRLDVELASATDPQEIKRLARDVAGLAPAADQTQVVFLARTPLATARNFEFRAVAPGDVDGRQRP